MAEDLYVLPASHGQEWMWLVHHVQRGQRPYHVGAALRIRGPVDAAALRTGANLLVERHESLRTTFRLEPSGVLNQIVCSAEAVDLPIVELPGEPAADGRASGAAVSAWVTEFSDRPFDLARGPLIRAALARLGPDDHVLTLVAHHVAADGWSMSILLDELGAIYRELVGGGVPDLPEPDLQYADFAAWQREWLGSGVMERQLDYWRDRLAGAPVLRLPPDPPESCGASAAHPIRLTPDRTAALGRLAREERATLFVVVLSALAAALVRWTGQDDIVVCTPVAGRPRPELDATVGLFAGTLPLRVDASGDPDFRALVRRARDGCFEAYDHQDVPFDKIVAAVEPDRSRRGVPLSPVMISLRTQWTPSFDQIPGAAVELVEEPPITGGFDIFAELAEDPGGGLYGYLVGDPAKYRPETVAALGGAFCDVLAHVGRDRGVPLSRLPLPSLTSPAAASGS
ncbi:condensation domain-containing protein [Nonomuraea sp. NPDC052116]|uniref:condensation domain-containing protein n=1 Tax=Nonomuraea sp. NPDC052116 TaxID=3155665 RepID=UPI00343CBF69